MLVKFSSLAGGCFIEVSDNDHYQDSDRAFRFDKHGNAEWAYVGALKNNDPSPRWYGHIFKKEDFIFA